MTYTLFEAQLGRFLILSIGIECYGEIMVFMDEVHSYDDELVDDFNGFSFLELHYAEDLFK